MYDIISRFAISLKARINRSHYWEKISTMESKELSDVDIKTLVSKTLNPSVDFEILEIHRKSYSDQTLGMLGSHESLRLRVKHQIDQQEVIQDFNYFVKSLPYSNKLQVKFMEDLGIFLEEVRFYREILPLLQTGSTDKWCARVYMILENDLMIMEDLKFQGYEMSTIQPQLSSEEAHWAVTTLANFHASSLAAELREGRRFEELFPEAFREKMFVLNEDQSWFNDEIDLVVRMAKKLGIPGDVEKIRGICQRVNDFFGKKGNRKRYSSLCHGDLWANNLMFDRQNGYCILVDFQLIRYAPIVLDLLQLLYLNLSKSRRMELEPKLISAYCKKLRENLTGEIPDEKDIFEDYERSRMYGLIVAITYLPVALLKPDIREKVLNNKSDIDNSNFSDNVKQQIMIDHLDANDWYRNRIEETLLEMMEISERVVDNQK